MCLCVCVCVCVWVGGCKGKLFDGKKRISLAAKNEEKLKTINNTSSALQCIVMVFTSRVN